VTLTFDRGPTVYFPLTSHGRACDRRTDGRTCRQTFIDRVLTWCSA